MLERVEGIITMKKPWKLDNVIGSIVTIPRLGLMFSLWQILYFFLFIFLTYKLVSVVTYTGKDP